MSAFTLPGGMLDAYMAGRHKADVQRCLAEARRDKDDKWRCNAVKAARRANHRMIAHLRRARLSAA